MRSHEMLTETGDSSIFPGNDIPGMGFVGNRGSRSHHIVTGINEEGHIYTVSVHPHCLPGFKAALAQVQEDSTLHLEYARSHSDYVPGKGAHGKKARDGGDNTVHAIAEFKSEKDDFPRVQEIELQSQLTANANLNITRTPNGSLIITERLADQHFRKITITSAPDMLPDHGTRTDLAIIVYEEINGVADPEKSSLLRVNLFLQPIEISTESPTPNFSTRELLQKVAAGMRIFQMFAEFDETYRNKFIDRLTDNLSPNADRYKELDPRQTKLFRSLSADRFEISEATYSLPPTFSGS